MSPIDDELRALLSDRASAVSPAPDPLGGIERRARRMRRNRVAASVAGSALMVAAVALAVPALRPDGGGTTQYASPQASPSAAGSPTAAAALPAAALDPQHPWAYRGDPAVVAGNELVTLRAEWTTKHPGTTLTPLFGQVYEPSAKPEVVFVSTSQGADRWGLATASEGGWSFLYDEALPFGTKVLMAALPGDEVARLLVLAAPSTGDISYAAEGVTYERVTMPQPGVAFIPLEGNTSEDAVMVLDGNGDLDNPVFRGPAPDSGAGSDGAPVATTPDNLLNWTFRGEKPSASVVQSAVKEFASQVQAQVGDVEHRAVFGGTDSAGRFVLLLQAWVHGNDARTFLYTTGNGGQLGDVTDKGPAVLAFLVPGAGNSDTQPGTLVVVGEPSAAHVGYAGTASSGFSTVEGGGAVLIDRSPSAKGDRIQLTTSEGTMIFRSDVVQVLCTTTDCG